MIKKIWKEDEAVSPVIAVILMVAITVVLAAVLYVWAQSFTDTGPYQAPGEASVEVVGDNYKVTIISMTQLSITETKFQLLDQYGGPRLKGDGAAIYDEVDLVEVELYATNQSFYETPTDDMPLNESDNAEYYFHVVFTDVDQNDRMNAGDVFLIKGSRNGGAARGSDVFRVISDQTKQAIFKVTLPTT